MEDTILSFPVMSCLKWIRLDGAVVTVLCEVPLDENVEAFRYTIPVSAMISRYADRPFEASLYIRKA
ncbi:MAG: hypothetical protein LUG61_05300 [Lachnospiraceae bacterium]|nr:hypothetical protein [Lachnospiraceae bacterium]